MKIFIHFSRYVFLALFCAVLFPFASQAQSDTAVEEKVLSVEEADALIKSLPKSDEAVKGKVPTEVDQEFYNIYTRQIAYGENTKEFRASIEERRGNFKNVSAPKKEEYNEIMDKVQRAQSADYQKSLNSEPSEQGIEVADFQMMDGQESEENHEMDQATAYDSMSSSQDAASGGLAERPIPPNPDEYGKVKKKVITSDDAPAFDPADLPADETMPVGEVPVEDDLNAHMSESGGYEVKEQEAEESPVELKMIPGSVVNDPLGDE